jgi:hypothetical protein
MAEVKLEILEPAHEANITGTTLVRLRGRQNSAGHPALFFKWYSSQVAPPGGSSDSSIRVPAGQTVFDMTVPLPAGTQVLTFSAKDQPGESAAEMQAVVDAGMAGGPPPAAKSPCVIHVLVANLVAPAGGNVSKAAAVLEAQAPPQWADPAYQAVNQLRFRFQFDPVGAPAGRAPAAFGPALVFVDSPEPPRLRYTGPLPAALGTGNYRLTLIVEKIAGAPASHQASRNINIVP